MCAKCTAPESQASVGGLLRRQICHRLLHGIDKRARDHLHECCRLCDAAAAGCRAEEFGGSVSWRLRETLHISYSAAGCARSRKFLQPTFAVKQDSRLELRVFGEPFSSRSCRLGIRAPCPVDLQVCRDVAACRAQKRGANICPRAHTKAVVVAGYSISPNKPAGPFPLDMSWPLGTAGSAPPYYAYIPHLHVQ